MNKFKAIFLYFDIFVAFLIFGYILYFKVDFYKVVMLILELIVIIELIQMLMVFFTRQRIKIRYMVDAFIIYVIRELMLSLTESHKDFKLMTFYLFLILSFFFFRYLALKITYKEEKD